MTAPLETVLSDPDWLPHSFDSSGDMLTFAHVPRPARADLTFLSDEHYKGQFTKETFPLLSAHRAERNWAEGPLHFIFHSSFCCSTLLAKALEVPGLSLTLREPDVLIYLANMTVRSGEAPNRDRLALTLSLLARPYATTEAVLVKPSNFANRLLIPTLNADKRSRAILLYSDVRTLLRSLAKKGIWGRVYGRQLYRNMASWTSLPLGFSPTETFDQTDLQIAALAWLMQIHEFNQAAGQFGPDRIVLLDSARLLEDVPGTLANVAEFFGINLDPGQTQDIANGPVFSRHSKLGQTPYSADVRKSDLSSLNSAHEEEIDVVVKWLNAVAGDAAKAMPTTFPAKV